jgi:hypothetical protein
MISAGIGLTNAQRCSVPASKASLREASSMATVGSGPSRTIAVAQPRITPRMAPVRWLIAERPVWPGPARTYSIRCRMQSSSSRATAGPRSWPIACALSQAVQIAFASCKDAELRNGDEALHREIPFRPAIARPVFAGLRTHVPLAFW